MHIYDLIAEMKNGKLKLSLGRIAFWAVFMVTLGKIVTTGVVDSTVLGLIAMLLTYGGFKKTSLVLENEPTRVEVEVDPTDSFCVECGQEPDNQTGERPCPKCALPTVHDPGCRCTGCTDAGY